MVGITTSGGIYGSTTGELGVYIGGSVGIWTNAGAGVGPTYTMVFGPPPISPACRSAWAPTWVQAYSGLARCCCFRRRLCDSSVTRSAFRSA